MSSGSASGRGVRPSARSSLARWSPSRCRAAWRCSPSRRPAPRRRDLRWYPVRPPYLPPSPPGRSRQRELPGLSPPCSLWGQRRPRREPDRRWSPRPQRATRSPRKAKPLPTPRRTPRPLPTPRPRSRRTRMARLPPPPARPPLLGPTTPLPLPPTLPLRPSQRPLLPHRPCPLPRRRRSASEDPRRPATPRPARHAGGRTSVGRPARPGRRRRRSRRRQPRRARLCGTQTAAAHPDHRSATGALAPAPVRKHTQPPAGDRRRARARHRRGLRPQPDLLGRR